MTIEKAINEVTDSPAYKNEGFTVDIRNNGVIVLCTGSKVTNGYMHSLSVKDSDNIARIIKMSIKEAKQ